MSGAPGFDPQRGYSVGDWGRADHPLLRAPAASADPAASLLAVAEGLAAAGIRQLLPSFGDGAPEWAKRIEIEGGLFQRGKGGQSILTVQPLYQSEKSRDTVFVQGSLYRYAMYGEYRITANLGLGYRRLLADDTVLLGANSFLDNEFTRNHRRYSVGAEAKWGPLDFGTNLYRVLTSERQFNDVIEQALDGWDIELGSKVPFVPWATAYFGHYRWQKHVAAENTEGNRFSLELALHPNVTLEAGRTDDNFSDLSDKHQSFVTLRFRLASLSRPTLSTGPVVSDVAFEKRNLADHTLDKVRRENRIIVERRTTGGIIIGRAN